MHELIFQEVTDKEKLNCKKIIGKQDTPTEERKRTIMGGHKIIVGAWTTSRRSTSPTAHPGTSGSGTITLSYCIQQ